MSRQWARFDARLPMRVDANDQGHIIARGPDREERTVEWDWIPATAPHIRGFIAHEWWANNGFTEWAKK